MKPTYQSNGVTIYNGNAADVLPELPAESIHCVVTSPPYWGLRDYGVAGQLGLEATPAKYIERLTAIFREVRRVLREDGTLWLNMGDTYATCKGACKNPGGGARSFGLHLKASGAIPAYRAAPNRMLRQGTDGIKAKDLIGVPWRLAFALQADGWFLRSDIIWHKPNPMPESVSDRPTKAHEYLFLLTKRARYYYSADAIKERPQKDFGAKPKTYEGKQYNWTKRCGGIRTKNKWSNPAGRNKRTVWTIPTEPYPEAHFATFPRALVKPCILAGCPAGGVVLDPFLGSGTTAAVARAQGCRCIGIELSAEYCKLAKKRLKQGILEFAESTEGARRANP